MSTASTPDAPTFGARVSRFFFLHLGTLVGLVVYFVVFDGNLGSEDGLRKALIAALIAHSAYTPLAWRRGEMKQADLGLWVFYAAGTAGAFAGIRWCVDLYRAYSPALVLATFTLTALLPPLFGGERFTAHYMRRSLPRWQFRLPVTDRIGRVLWAFWVGIFAVSTALAASAPLDPLFTALYPNLLILGPGLTAQYWLPPLYLRLFPPGPPDTVEPMIMGLPLVFDARAARGVSAEIQFCVSGDDTGEYWVRIADGRCRSFEGRAPAPVLTVHTPAAVWLGIARGEIDGTQALAQGRYRFSGDGAVLAAMASWFPTARS